MKERKSNFELLRIILMLLIISGHLILNSGKTDLIGNPDYFITNILRSFTVYGVNTFILLSGYFGIHLNLEKLIKFDIRIVFYTVSMYVLSIILNMHVIEPIKDVKLLFPVITKQYWFITIYFVLCFFSPFINKFLGNLSKEELLRFLAIGFIIFYVISTFCFMINANQIVNDAGYGLINFIYLYMLGYYIKHYHEDKYGAGFYLIVYIMNSILIFASNHIMTTLTGFYFNSFISYNTVFVLIGSVSLLMLFKNINLKTKKSINKISTKTLAVYIIHTNPSISDYVFHNIIKIDQITRGGMILKIILIPFVIYCLCYLIDCIVDIVLKPIEQQIGNVMIFKKKVN